MKKQIFLLTALSFFVISAYGLSFKSFNASNINLGNLKQPKIQKLPKSLGGNSYIPRLYFSGYAGSSYLGQADLLFPVLQRYDRDLFVYAEGRYSTVNRTWGNNPWLGSLGFGYRQIFSQDLLVGLYGLIDYNKTISDKVIDFAPGIELLTKNWDVRLNGYYPITKAKWQISGWADEFGDYRYVSYKKHDEYDHWYTYNVATGIGADAEIGRKLFAVWGSIFKGYLSGYYFAMKTNDNLMGAGVKLTMQPNTYLKFTLTDTFDNYAKNTVMAGFEVSLYDLFTDAHAKVTNLSFTHHLYEPIDRNFGQIGVGNSIPTTMYGDYFEHHSHPHDHGGGVEHTNIWFFNGSDSTANSTDNNPAAEKGTYENPYTSEDFNNTTLNEIAGYAKSKGYKTTYLYFNPGIYSANNGNNSPVEVLPSDVIEGKMGGAKGFKYDATGDSRPQFIGGFIADSNTAMNNVRLVNSESMFSTGIVLNNAQNVTLNDVNIGANAVGKGYYTGLSLQNSDINLKNTTIYGYNNNNSAYTTAAGILIKDSGNINAEGQNSIMAISKNGIGAGIYLEGSANALFANISSKQYLNIQGQGSSGYGMYADNPNGDINLNNLENLSFNGSTDGVSLTGQNISISNINGSTFKGGAAVDNEGMYLKASKDINITNIFGNKDSIFHGGDNGAYLSANKVTINNISNYQFTGGVGLSIYASDITLGSISASNFVGNDGDGLHLISDRNKGNVNIGYIENTTFSSGTQNAMHLQGANVNIKGISDSYFSSQSAAGIYIDTNDATGNVNIGNIVADGDSAINGENPSIKGGNYGLEITGNSVTLGNISNYVLLAGIGGAALTVKATKTINIGNIDQSSFSAKNSSLDLEGETINVKNIDGSSFNGKTNGAYLAGNNITINAINNSYLTGTGIGLDIHGQNLVTLGGITNSNFIGQTDDGIYISANDINIGDVIGNGGSIIQGGHHGAYLTGNSVTIGNIANYKFNGNDASNASALDIMTAKAIKIGNVTTSEFIGNEYGWLLYGSGDEHPIINIGNITGTATNNTKFSGSQDGIHIHGKEVVIGKIDYINTAGEHGSGLYLNSDVNGNHISEITNSTFSGTYSIFTRGSLHINGNKYKGSYQGASDALEYILGKNNKLTSAGTKKVCIDGYCDHIAEP